MRVLLIILFLPSLALGAEKRPLKIAACEDPEQLSRQIVSCTDNVLAEKAAKACGDALASEWKKANATLTLLMQNKSAGAQNAQLGQSNADLAFTVAELDELILATQNAADRLARYPRIMFDNPYAGPGLDGSSSCYKKPFHAIAKVVNDLDEKADEGQEALAATERLERISISRVASLAGSAQAPVATGHAVAAEPAHAAPKAASSDITGVREDEAKQAGSLAPLPEVAPVKLKPALKDPTSAAVQLLDAVIPVQAAASRN